jgi:hypothetical protein
MTCTVAANLTPPGRVKLLLHPQVPSAGAAVCEHAMDRHQDNVKVQEVACGALRNLEENRHEQGDALGSRSGGASSARWTGTKTMRNTAACSALLNLAVKESQLKGSSRPHRGLRGPVLMTCTVAANLTPPGRVKLLLHPQVPSAGAAVCEQDIARASSPQESSRPLTGVLVECATRGGWQVGRAGAVLCRWQLGRQAASSRSS